MQLTENHKKIVQYYQATEHAYKDAWDLDNSLAIHYGYWDEKVKSFPQSLLRMNEVMMEAAGIKPGDRVLDAGCGIGGSSIFLAKHAGCKTTGISLSERQVRKAGEMAQQQGVNAFVDFKVMDYSQTSFDSEQFDVVWGCESICYAEDKGKFIQEAHRLLKPGGRLVVADGFVSAFDNNLHQDIRKWLDGWQVNYLETPERFQHAMSNAGFININFRDISSNVLHSAKRLNRFFYLASAYLAWKTISFSKPATEMQKGNIRACRYQYLALKKKLWKYMVITGTKGVGCQASNGKR